MYIRFYTVGKLDESDMVHYVRTHALMYEYYRQAQENVPPHIGRVLHELFTSEAYQIVNSRYVLQFSRKIIFKVHTYFVYICRKEKL